MADGAADTKAPRVAIRFGGSSIAPKTANGLNRQNKSVLGKRPRSYALNHDSESDDDESSGRHHAVTSFGVNGAEHDKPTESTKELKNNTREIVIPCGANRDWKAEKRARGGGGPLLPHEAARLASEAQTTETEPADEDKEVKWGLNITKKASKAQQGSGEDSNSVSIDLGNSPEPKDTEIDIQKANDDRDAVDALMGNRRMGENMVIGGQRAEVDALQRSYDVVGEVSTIDEYDQIPDGEFGAAMLRGMGWDGALDGVKPKEVKRRQNLLGLGAKEDEEIKKAELAKKHGHRERRPRLDEYRRDKEKERQQREEKHSNSYKKERERDRIHHSRRHDDRDRERDREAYQHRHHGREGDRARHGDFRR